MLVRKEIKFLLLAGIVSGIWILGKNVYRMCTLVQQDNYVSGRLISSVMAGPKCRLKIAKLRLTHDQDGDGISDPEDILKGARQEAAKHPRYHDAYYRGGYPPDKEGVCTDVIWRAFREAGYDLKTMVDRDIRKNSFAYPCIAQPDPNIDFRRVLNLSSFFQRYAQSLTLKINPWNIKNLQEWQGGDIVIFGPPRNHIAIVSERRRKDGVPYIIHNCPPYAREEDALLYRLKNISPIVGHYRWAKE